MVMSAPDQIDFFCPSGRSSRPPTPRRAQGCRGGLANAHVHCLDLVTLALDPFNLFWVC
jgi:hypothetical protein